MDTKDNKKDVGKTPGKTDSGKLTVDGQVLIKHGKGRNPMVKMASKDSGYSVQSQSSSQSGGSKNSEVDNISLDSQSNPKRADSGVGSINQGYTPDMMIADKTIARLRNPLIKQESSGNVSYSLFIFLFSNHAGICFVLTICTYKYIYRLLGDVMVSIYLSIC